MKCVSLWQPWASLVAVGAKRVETRHWPAPASVIGQRIAIHAAKTRDHLDLVLDEPFSRYLPNKDLLPLGAVVCTAVLAKTAAMYSCAIDELREKHPDEHAFGLYEPGRFAWVLRDVQSLPLALECRGHQGLFNVPDELLLRLGASAGPEPEQRPLFGGAA
jgi:hypothetical protein